MNLALVKVWVVAMGLSTGRLAGTAASPSSPEPLSAQHHTVPSFLSAHMNLFTSPDASWVTPLISAGVGAMGPVPLMVLGPEPASPAPLVPQHCTVPSEIRAQAMSPPVAS